MAWSEMHGASMRRWHLDETVQQVGGMLITDSRGIFDGLTRSESPQLRLCSSRTSEEARGIKAQCAVSDARIHWVNTSTMLADSQTKTAYPARAVMESFLVKKRWRCTFDPSFESSKRRKATGAPLFNHEDLDEIPTTPFKFGNIEQPKKTAKVPTFKLFFKTGIDKNRRETPIWTF